MEEASVVADRVSCLILDGVHLMITYQAAHMTHVVSVCVLPYNQKIKAKDSHLIQAEVPVPLSNSLPEAVRKRVQHTMMRMHRGQPVLL